MPAALASCERRVERLGVVRVEDDRVDALGDQVTEVLELAGRVRVAVDDGQLGHLAGGERLGLGGADLLLAEAVADAAAVRVADLVAAGRLAGGLAGRSARRALAGPRSAPWTVPRGTPWRPSRRRMRRRGARSRRSRPSPGPCPVPSYAAFSSLRRPVAPSMGPRSAVDHTIVSDFRASPTSLLVDRTGESPRMLSIGCIEQVPRPLGSHHAGAGDDRGHAPRAHEELGGPGLDGIDDGDRADGGHRAHRRVEAGDATRWRRPRRADVEHEVRDLEQAAARGRLGLGRTSTGRRT